MIFTQILSILLLPLVTCFKFRSYSPKVSHVAMGYIDDLAAAMMAKGGKRCQVGITTDSWNIGRGKFKSYLSVYKLPSAIEKLNIQTCSHAMWEVARGPHYDDLQALFESYWVPDLMSTKNMILDYDLVILPDPTIAKYMVEAYYEKEFKVAAKIADYKKKANKPYGNFESFPPNERYEYERIMNLSKQKWIRKFPPLATCGEEAYMRIRNHAQVEYYSHGVDDFALYLPPNIVPSKRVLLLRFRNRFDTLLQSLTMRGLNVTSAYPVTWLRKEWNDADYRNARNSEVVYFHEVHALQEWVERTRDFPRPPVAACHDIQVARAAKDMGFKDVFYAKKPDVDGLLATVKQAVEHFKANTGDSSGRAGRLLLCKGAPIRFTSSPEACAHNMPPLPLPPLPLENRCSATADTC